MLVSDPVDDGIKIFHAFQMKVTALFHEGYSLPLMVHKPAVEEIQKRLDQWRAKLPNDSLITSCNSRVLRSRKVYTSKDIKPLMKRLNSEGRNSKRIQQKRRNRKQPLRTGVNDDRCEPPVQKYLPSKGQPDGSSKGGTLTVNNIKEEAGTKLIRKHLQCEECDKVLKTEKGFAEHQEMHRTGPKICPECGKVLHSKSSIYVHKKMHQQVLECPHCNYSAAQRSWLKQHIIAVHNKEQKYLCDICAKAFCYESVLKRHIEALHSNGEWIQCEQCDYSTRTKQCLKRHILNRHTANVPKWMCDLCGNVFRSKAILEDHRHLHLGEKRFKCTKCSDTFSCRSSKNRHLRTVHGEKQFPCVDCGKLFSEKVYLRRHAVIHTGEKNFTCGFCDYCCNTRGNLRKHWRVVHKKKDHDLRQQKVTRLFGCDADKALKTAGITTNGAGKDHAALQDMEQRAEEQYCVTVQNHVERPREQYCLTAPNESNIESSMNQANNSSALTALPSSTMAAYSAHCTYSLLKPVTKVIMTCDEKPNDVLPSSALSPTKVRISEQHKQVVGMTSPVAHTVQHNGQGQVLQYTTLQNWQYR